MEPRKVWVMDNNSDNIVVTGDIVNKMHDGIVRAILNIRYIHNLKQNLISLWILKDKGHIFKSNNNILEIMKFL